MPGKLHEGMTRTPGPPRKAGQKGRAMLLAVLAATLLLLGLATTWALGGGGGHEARAQSSGDDSGGAVQSGEDSGTIPDRDSDYAAFGEERNPFNPVVAEAETEGAETTNDDGGAGDDLAEGDGGPGVSGDPGGDADGADAAENQDNADTPGSQGPASLQERNGEDGDGGASQAPQDGNPAAGGAATTPNGEQVDCSNIERDFDRLLCEEERNGNGGLDAADRPGSAGQRAPADVQGPPGSGGSGRSGAGQPSEDFRNGGNAGGGTYK